MKRYFLMLFTLGAFAAPDAEACTGISLMARDGSYVLSRTIEWGASELESGYVIVPRGMEIVSYTPEGMNGMKFKAKYGFAGLTVAQKEFVAEGLNEAGLSAGLFYFPGYGQYPEYDPKASDVTVTDLQLVSWMLSQFATVDEVRAALESVRITSLPGASTIHWRVADKSGKQIVIEVVGGKVMVYDNLAGVLTNSPGFEWQVTNLNNYVNAYPGPTDAKSYDQLTVFPFGAGAGMLGLPGDVTPPSRFVRAFFYKSTAPELATAKETVMQSFSILNNFDIPVGVEFKEGEAPDIPSATQWTSSADLCGLKLYYRTMYNSTIRCIDLSAVDFAKVDYVYAPLDMVKEQPVEYIRINNTNNKINKK